MKVQKFRPSLEQRRAKLESLIAEQKAKISRFNRDFAAKFPNLWFKTVKDWKEQIKKENRHLAELEKKLKRLDLPNPPERPKQLRMFS